MNLMPEAKYYDAFFCLLVRKACTYKLRPLNLFTEAVYPSDTVLTSCKCNMIDKNIEQTCQTVKIGNRFFSAVAILM